MIIIFHFRFVRPVNKPARPIIDFLFKNRSVKNERVKLSVFAARVDIFRQIAKKIFINHPSGKRRIKILLIDANNDRQEA